MRLFWKHTTTTVAAAARVGRVRFGSKGKIIPLQKSRTACELVVRVYRTTSYFRVFVYSTTYRPTQRIRERALLSSRRFTGNLHGRGEHQKRASADSGDYAGTRRTRPTVTCRPYDDNSIAGTRKIRCDDVFVRLICSISSSSLFLSTETVIMFAS